MDGMTRRGFISRSSKGMLTVVGGAAVAALPGKARAVSANDRVVMAVVGVGGRGRDVSRQFVNSRGAVMAYVCDADEKRIGSYPDQLERLQKRAPKAVQDMRRVFDDKEVDAVLVSTCDHWHGLATVWACQAGKDVYVEKPPCHNLWEGQRMVEAARKYNRVVQCGLQNRSAAYALAAREYIQSGKLGDIP
ncbi:MAG TPA: Gfo/Idh/MocA family oxidoreductase, partial [Candidatus Hydrogenedentes bacterium]|nr:Gfo/Idh/MocA family oxidoreductase [Candidatus Hydrogenedentota bacterium]